MFFQIYLDIILIKRSVFFSVNFEFENFNIVLHLVIFSKLGQIFSSRTGVSFKKDTKDLYSS